MDVRLERGLNLIPTKKSYTAITEERRENANLLPEILAVESLSVLKD